MRPGASPAEDRCTGVTHARRFARIATHRGCFQHHFTVSRGASTLTPTTKAAHARRAEKAANKCPPPALLCLALGCERLAFLGRDWGKGMRE